MGMNALLEEEAEEEGAPLQSLVVHITTPDQLRSVCSALKHDFESVTLDTEASGKDPLDAVPLLLQVGDESTAYVIQLNQFTPEELAPLWKVLKDKTIVGHNLNYDYRLLRSHYDIPQWNYVYDTQLAEQLLTAGDYDVKERWLKEALSLKALVNKYLGIELDKDVRETFLSVPESGNWQEWDPTNDQVLYAGTDVLRTAEVANVQIERLVAEGLSRAAQARFGALIPLAEVELRGMTIDVEAWRAYLKTLEVELQDVAAALTAKLDVYEQRYRAVEYEMAVSAREAWEEAKDDEEARLKAQWQAQHQNTATISPRSTPASTVSSTVTDGISTSTTASQQSGRHTAPSTSTRRTLPSEKPTPSSLPPSSPGVVAPHPAPPSQPTASSPLIPPSSSMTSSPPSWGQYKLVHLRTWRQAHPLPPKPKLDPAPINLNSPDQVKRAYAALGLQLPISPTTDKETADSKARAALLKSASLSKEQREALELHQRYAKLSKLLSAFGENILAKTRRSRQRTGLRLHTTYNIGLTDTGRMSSHNPNFQNFPASNELRHCFVADPGTVVITLDFKSQELAIAAALSGDEAMKADLAAGRDLYKELAVTVFGLKGVEEVDDKQRKTCKNALLGISYGLTPVGMEKKNGVPQAIGRKAIAAIKQRYPKLFAFAEANAEKALHQRVVTTALGAKRYFRRQGEPDWQVANQGRNAPIQGTGGDIVYTLAHRLEDYAVPFDILPVNYVHDEVVVLAPIEQAEEARQVVVMQMQEAFNDVLPYETYGVRCGVSSYIGPWWHKD